MPKVMADWERERPAGEAEIYARLEATVAAWDMRVCDGCTQCATRCVEGLEISFPEFSRVVRALRSVPAAELGRVVSQDKRLIWGEEAVAYLCPLLDRANYHCLVYPARPLVCRLFGWVVWLPCPIGKVSNAATEGVSLMQQYATLERHSLREWLRLYPDARLGLPPELGRLHLDGQGNCA